MLVRKLKNINAKQKTKVEKIGEWLKIAWRIYVIYRGRREKNVLTSAKRNFHHKYPHSKSDSLETWPEFVIWFFKKMRCSNFEHSQLTEMSMMYVFSQNFIEPAEWPTYGKFPFNLITEWKPHEWKPALKSMSTTAVQYNSIFQWIQTGIEIQIKSTNAKCA